MVTTSDETFDASYVDKIFSLTDSNVSDYVSEMVVRTDAVESLVDNMDVTSCGIRTKQVNFTSPDSLIAHTENSVDVTSCDMMARQKIFIGSACLLTNSTNVSNHLSQKNMQISYDAIKISPADEEPDDTSYIPGLHDSVALRCLAFLPWTEHWRLALLSRRHRDLVQEGLLLRIREHYDMSQQWICIYTSGNNGWIAYDPHNNSWRNLPHANVDPDFDLSDKESLSAGPHLLWLGREIFNFACYRYDLCSDSWERGPTMVHPRCLFASASSGPFAFIAGGFSVGGSQFNVLNTAERYNSLKGIWEPLPSMSIARHKCSGFFMDGKFYVIGGKSANHETLSSGEEFDPETNKWRTIENMYPYPESASTFEPSPPLVAVAGNELYAIESSSNLLKVYNKHMNTWKSLGLVPVRADFCNGWGLALKALGNELFVIGRHHAPTGEIEGVSVFSWHAQPDISSPEWKLLNSRIRGTGNFLFNCAVMVRP